MTLLVDKQVEHQKEAMGVTTEILSSIIETAYECKKSSTIIRRNICRNDTEVEPNCISEPPHMSCDTLVDTLLKINEILNVITTNLSKIYIDVQGMSQLEQIAKELESRL